MDAPSQHWRLRSWSSAHRSSRAFLVLFFTRPASVAVRPGLSSCDLSRGSTPRRVRAALSRSRSSSSEGSKPARSHASISGCGNASRARIGVAAPLYAAFSASTEVR
jgi:hypothetical protein